MAGSQLKRLRASLREKGVIGPQQSKKQKKRNAQERRANGNDRPNKAAALEGIRESFNPFDLKHSVRGPKFEVTSNRPPASKGINGRPSEAKALGEERRRQTLLVEMNRKNKTGGILDRRFGEDDQNLTPEQKMLERFVREKQLSRNQKKGSLFDLEDDDDQPGAGLTHMGKSLSFDGAPVIDDFEEDDLGSGSDDDGDGSSDERRALKRMRSAVDEDMVDAADGEPERKKTKKEIYEEIIAKSKFHKAQRQEAKDADEDLRDEIDAQLPDLHELLLAGPKSSKAAPNNKDSMDAHRAKLERDYDMRLKMLAQDRRAQPDQRTKTDEEKAQEESERLRELEDKRQRRMQGQAEDSSEEEEENAAADDPEDDDQVMFQDNYDDDEFGLGKGISKTRPAGLDDEDDFLIEDDLIASGSDLEPVSDDESGEDSEANAEDEDDDEFTKGLLNEEESKNPVFRIAAPEQSSSAKDPSDGLPYTFACPETHQELVDLMESISSEKLPTVIQRIRALYHPKLDSSNKGKMSNFSRALVQHLAYLPNQPSPASFAVMESVVRHVHSLAKTYPVEIANEFRANVEAAGRLRPSSPNLGDLTILTAINTIFPTSDYWHQVVTPAMLLMARWLEQIPKQVVHYARTAFLATLALQYQSVSKRFAPEVMNTICNTLSALAPAKPTRPAGLYPAHEPTAGVRTVNASACTVRNLRPSDCAEDTAANEEVKVAILATTMSIADAAAEIWSAHKSFEETFDPIPKLLGHLLSKACKSELPAALCDRAAKLKSKLERMLRLAHMARRPLELHHHKPLAIKMAIPKFEDQFDPNKHYDPDRDRAELAKLQKEHKRERKGAMRELRKDANFMQREKLRAKKVRDAAYEKKYKRLVAEIQGEEGREANEYEREKQARKRAAKRG